MEKPQEPTIPRPNSDPITPPSTIPLNEPLQTTQTQSITKELRCCLVPVCCVSKTAVLIITIIRLIFVCIGLLTSLAMICWMAYWFAEDFLYNHFFSNAYYMMVDGSVLCCMTPLFVYFLISIITNSCLIYGLRYTL